MSGFDASTIAKIVELADTKVVTIAGKEYATQEVEEVIPQQFDFPTIRLSSLEGLVAYIEKNIDGADLGKCQIVCYAEAVYLFSEPKGARRLRDTLARVEAGSVFEGLEKWMSQEQFRIWMMTRFVSSKDRDDLLTLLSRVIDDTSITTEDNGMSQSVTAKVGVAAQGQVAVPPSLTLKAIRTFIEVDQPEGTFICRLRKNPSTKGLEIALFEVATNWQREAAKRVQDRLEDLLADSEILVLA